MKKLDNTNKTNSDDIYIHCGRPRNPNIVRDNTAQKGLTKEWTRSTFILRVEQLEKLKDYAYTERLTIKEALENILDEFFADKHNLLHRRKK